MRLHDSELNGGIAPESTPGRLVATLLRPDAERIDSVLAALRRHRIPAAAVVDVALTVAPAIADDQRWNEAVRGDRERAARLRRTLASSATALADSQRVAVLSSVFGPLWMRDVDLLVGHADVRPIGDLLLRAGFLDLAGFSSRRRRPSDAFAAVQGIEVLGRVDLTTRLFPGGPRGERALARAVQPAPGELRVLAVEDQLRRRAGKVTQARCVTLRDALELRALVDRVGDAVDDRMIAVALRRTAALERKLGFSGVGAAPPGPGAVSLPWLVARSRAVPSRARRLGIHRRVRVSFSGVDGAGKSTQAALLVSALGRAEVPTSAVWARLGYTASPLLTGAGRLAQRLLPGRHHSAQERRSAGVVGSSATPTSRRGLVGWTWALAVTIDYLIILRRSIARAPGDVVVFDRGVADALVALEAEFGGALNLDLHRRLVLRAGPVADVMFHLRLAGRAAHARKEDSFASQVLEAHARHYEEVLPALRGTVVTVDAERSPREIAYDVIRTLSLELSGRHDA